MVGFSNLEKLTIVILTYNRHKYLKRTIHYWSNYNVNLVILDGSEKKLEDQYIEAKNESESTSKLLVESEASREQLQNELKEQIEEQKRLNQERGA